jgi:hypothetical protein
MGVQSSLLRKWQWWVVTIPYFLILKWVYSSYGGLALFLGFLTLLFIKFQIFIRIIRSMIKAQFKEKGHILGAENGKGISP